MIRSSMPRAGRRGLPPMLRQRGLRARRMQRAAGRRAPELMRAQVQMPIPRRRRVLRRVRCRMQALQAVSPAPELGQTVEPRAERLRATQLRVTLLRAVRTRGRELRGQEMAAPCRTTAFRAQMRGLFRPLMRRRFRLRLIRRMPLRERRSPSPRPRRRRRRGTARRPTEGRLRLREIRRMFFRGWRSIPRGRISTWCRSRACFR